MYLYVGGGQYIREQQKCGVDQGIRNQPQLSPSESSVISGINTVTYIAFLHVTVQNGGRGT